MVVVVGLGVVFVMVDGVGDKECFVVDDVME